MLAFLYSLKREARAFSGADLKPTFAHDFFSFGRRAQVCRNYCQTCTERVAEMATVVVGDDRVESVSGAGWISDDSSYYGWVWRLTF